MKDALWEAARASTESEFKKCMEGIKLISQAAYDYLMEANPKFWSRHAFSPREKIDEEVCIKERGDDQLPRQDYSQGH